MRRIGVFVAALLALPSATAQPEIDIEVLAGDPLVATLEATGEDQFVNLTVRARLGADRVAYVKATPTPWHPAVANGTVDGDGWWTEVWGFDGDGSWSRIGATDGSAAVWLEDLPAGDHHLITLRIHVPGAAQVEGTQYRLSYVVAVAERHAGTSTGGVLDPSVPLLAVVSVASLGGPGPADAEVAAPPSIPAAPSSAVAVVSFAMMALVLVGAAITAMVIVRHRG